MKLYDRNAFLTGVLALCALLVFAFGILEARPGTWILLLVIAGRAFYVALSKEGNRRNQFLTKHYDAAAEALFGRHHRWKTNLPLVVIAVFFVIALLLRFCTNRIFPIWIALIFVITLLLSTAYSVGLHHQIKEYIDSHYTEDPND